MRQGQRIYSIEDCACYFFESTIPQVTKGMFGGMRDFDLLNTLAAQIVAMSPYEEVKFKAALCAEKPEDLAGVLDIVGHLEEYEFSAAPENERQFFKEYLQHHFDSRLDSRWLDTAPAGDEGDELLKRLKASVTRYGILSARGHSLYEFVPYDMQEAERLAGKAVPGEKLDVIEVLGRKALFSNGRFAPEEIPKGLYAYDLRYSDEENGFVTIEPKVWVDHGGSVLMKEPLQFGESGYIPFTEESSPNFLSEEMTAEEFAETAEIDMDEREALQMGGMGL